MYPGSQHFKRRVVVVAVVLCSVVVVALPLNAVSADSTCKLDCCAARAPHAAGSCVGGTCHAVIKDRRHAHAASLSGEKFCHSTLGTGAWARLFTASRLLFQASRTNNRPQLEADSSSIAQPCPADCGAVTSAFGAVKGSTTRVNSAWRPQSAMRIALAAIGLRPQTELRRRSVPRGPPSRLS